MSLGVFPPTLGLSPAGLSSPLPLLELLLQVPWCLNSYLNLLPELEFLLGFGCRVVPAQACLAIHHGHSARV